MNTSKLFRQTVKALADEYHLRLHTLTQNMTAVNELNQACIDLALLPIVQVSDCGTLRLTAMSVGPVVTDELWSRIAAHRFEVGSPRLYASDPSRQHFESFLKRNGHRFNLVYSVNRVSSTAAVPA
ncbi:hypothetical protein [Herminiimonas contaminans]|uniref:LysR substrate binding domain-containing protein n=1 Tax=Herminiimonas contaminans TaxID=1111140 RepID=A0ABS0ESV8_9BURK|nr:hypothetical protein [Herminiimonas contaminans]MBF8176942.1 hypothetical protein [Herminiimonas contaminans]